MLEHICAEVAERHAAGDDIVIVTSGAIARGIGVMELQRRPATMADLQAASAVGQGKLYRVYDELLRERGVTSAQVLLTFFDVGHRGHYLNARQTLGRLLDWRVVPVINENDTTATEEISFGDNDFLAAQVAILVGADRLVLLTNQDGLHTADPRTTRRRARRARSTDVRELAGYSIGHVPSELGSGGMRSKVVAAEMATAAGIPATICSGLRDGVLARRSRARPRARASRRRSSAHSSFKLWLKYAKPAHGHGASSTRAPRARCARAGRRCCRSASSRSTGEFDEGDAIEIRDAGGGPLAKGISSYAAPTCAARWGAKSAACASCCRARPTRSCIATTSCCCERRSTLSRMAITSSSVAEQCAAAKRAARGSRRPTAARAMPRCTRSPTRSRSAPPEILEANARDMEAGREAGLSDALLDRLRLDAERVARIADGVRADRRAARSGRRGDRRRAPGERARPAQGPRPARRRRRRLRGAAERDDRRRGAVPEVGERVRAARLLVGGALQCGAGARRGPGGAGAGLPEGSVTLVAGGGREELAELATQEGNVDLIIPRGGEGLKKALEGVATVPVIYAASGNCHVYVDRAADLEKALAIAVNAKTQRPGVCNAAETLLVHADVAEAFLPRCLRALAERGVELRVDGRARALAGPALAETRSTRAKRTGTRSSWRWCSRSAWSTRSTRRSSTSALRLRALGGDRHRGPGGGAGVRARRRRGVHLRQRVDAVHRRRRVRDGRGDRQLDAEAARARADRAARAVQLQVRGRR